MSARLIVCLKKSHVPVFFDTICRCVLWLNVLQQVSEWISRNLHARNTLVQLLVLYTNPESHNTQRYKRTDRRTDRL